MEHKRQQRLWTKCRISTIYQIRNLNDFIFTFGIARRREDEVRVEVGMDYIASDELGNLVRLGFVLDVQFPYVVRSVQHITILLNMFNVPSMTYPTAGPG
jgi:hypothetical protein